MTPTAPAPPLAPNPWPGTLPRETTLALTHLLHDCGTTWGAARWHYGPVLGFLPSPSMHLSELTPAQAEALRADLESRHRTRPRAAAKAGAA